jgi:flavorubredoxin
MNGVFQTIISALALLGLGGIVGGYITYLLDKKKAREFKVLEQKERRYRSCILYMDAFFEPKNIKYLSSHHPDINEANDVIEYLKMEFFEMTLYASREVIFAVKRFIEQPSRESFLTSILAMRRDLGSKKIDLAIDDIELKIGGR